MKVSNAQCPNKIILHLRPKDYSDKKTYIKVLPCNQWKCPVCGQKKAWRLRKKIKQSNANNLNYFLTLTLRTNNLSTKENTEKLSYMFTVLKKRIRRLYPEWKYFRVIEFTKNKMPHYHLVMNIHIRKSTLKEWWFDITKDSYIVDVQKLKTKNYNYLLKYFLKGAENKSKTTDELAKHFRLYTTSRGLLLQDIREQKYYLISFIHNLENYLSFGSPVNLELNLTIISYKNKMGNYITESIADIINRSRSYKQINNIII